MQMTWAIVWKEWLSLRWKLAALCAILFVPLFGLAFYDSAFSAGSFDLLLIAYCAIAPIFFAMHAAAEESAAGTLEFVRGLPIPLARLALWRLLATLAALLAPLAAAAGIMYAAVLLVPQWAPTFSAFGNGAGQALGPTLMALSVSASLFAWTAALAMNQPSELRAGVIGLVTAVVWGVWTLMSIAQWDNGPGNWTWLYGVTALGPFAAPVMADPGLTVAGRFAMACGQLATLLVLICIGARRYGVLERTGGWRRFSPSSPASALWWMQWREAWPLGIAGLATTLALSAVGAARLAGARDEVLLFRMMVQVSSAGLGAVWAIIMAATLFSAELEPRLVEFWRSRPIDPAAWFRVKYLTGAIVLFACVDLPAVLAAVMGGPFASPKTESLVAFLTCVPVMHLALYSLAVLIACLVRHTIYAGILALGTAMLILIPPTMAPQTSWISRLNVLSLMADLLHPTENSRPETWALRWAVYLAFTAALTTASTWLARRAVQKDVAVRV